MNYARKADVTTKVGIVGCGYIGCAHRNVYSKEDTTIVGVTDANPDVARMLADECDEIVYKNYRELIDDAAPDVISICTPPVAHKEIAVYALERGVHVLCEKPIAFDIASAYRMRDVAGRSSAIFMPAFRHRFLPAIVFLRDLLGSGEIGEPVLFNNTFCAPAFDMEQKWFTKRAISGGGCVLDTSSHSVDLFRFLVGEIIEQALVSHRHFKTTDVEDAGILSVKAANGTLGTLQSSFVAGMGVWLIDIVGTMGRVVFDYAEGDNVRYKSANSNDWQVQQVTPSDGFAGEIQHFIGAIRGEHPLDITVSDGVRAMEVICDAYNGAQGLARAGDEEQDE